MASRQSILDRILATKLDEVTLLHDPRVRNLLRRQALDAPPTRPFQPALHRDDGTLALIAELKRRSPSKGELAPDLDPAATAKDYVAGGASALSVLTDGPFFGGSVADLQAAREAVDVPVLRKDFVIDEAQVFETRAIGADAMLLILAALPDDALLRDLLDLGLALGLGVLVEAHSAEELERGLRLGAPVLGVNARDLGTFTEDLAGATALASRIPPEVIAVAESAIRAGPDAARVAAAGFDAVLVGEALVTAADPTVLAQELRAHHVGSRTPG